MDERFVPLATFVRGLAPAAPAPVASPPAAAAVAAQPAVDPGDASAAAVLVQELTLMRLAAHEAFERASVALLRSLAEHVLGRELALRPADVAELVARVLAESAEIEPVALVVGPSDAQRLQTPLPTRIDPSLETGDFIVEVRDGALESRFAFRLQAALARAHGPA